MINKKGIFAGIAAIIAIIATITFASEPNQNQSINTRTITFSDGSIINKVEIEVGSKDKLPEGPKKDNQVFIGWYIDGTDTRVVDYSTILEDTTLKAHYAVDINGNNIPDEDEKKLTVTFYDTVSDCAIKTELVLPGLNAYAPSAPSHKGYTFTGWEGNYENVKEDIKINAVYVKNEEKEDVKFYTVKFVDSITGKVVNTQSVQEGYSATTPKIPNHNKKVFDKFDTSYTNIREDKTINILYAEDLNSNGKNDLYDEYFFIEFIAKENGSLKGTTLYENILYGLTYEEAGIEIPTPTPDKNFIFDKWNTEFGANTVVEEDVLYVAKFMLDPEKEMKVDTTEVIDEKVVYDDITEEEIKEKVSVDLTAFEDVTSNVYVEIPTDCTDEALKDCNISIKVDAKVGTKTITYTETKTIKILKRKITVNINNATSAYSDEIVPLTSDVEPYKGHDVLVNLSTEATSEKDVEDYDITGTWENKNYDVTFVNGTYSITPKQITVNVNGSVESNPYNTELQTATGASFTTENKLYDVSNIDTNKLLVAMGTEVGTYQMGLISDNFTNLDKNYDVTFVVNDGKLVITPDMNEVEVIISGNNNNDGVTYDKESHTVKGYTTNVGTKTIIVVPTKEDSNYEVSRTNAGTSKMNLDASDFKVTSKNYGNIKVTVVDGYVKVNKIPSTTVYIEGATKDTTYNFKDQTVNGYEVTSPIDETIKVTPNKEVSKTVQEPGKHSMGLTSEDFEVTSDNYEIVNVVYKDGYINIDKIEEGNVTITGKNNGKGSSYNKENQIVSGYTIESDKNITITPKKESYEVSRKNAGTTELVINKNDFEITSPYYKNINVTTKNGYIKINPSEEEVIINVTGNTKTETYNKKEHSVTGYTYSKSVEDDSVDIKLTSSAEAKGTNAGTYKMNLKSSDFEILTDNYSNVTVTVTDGYVKVNPIEGATLKITGNKATKEYNFENQVVEGYTLSIDDETIKVTPKKEVKVSAKDIKSTPYYMGLTESDFEVISNNYKDLNVVYVDGSLTITKIPYFKLVITGDTKTVTYNREKHSINGFTTNDNLGGFKVSLKTLYKNTAKVENKTDAGTYTMGLKTNYFNVSTDVYEDYEVEVVDGKLTINKSDEPILITITGKNKTYEASTEILTRTVTGWDYTTNIEDSTIKVSKKALAQASVSSRKFGTHYMGLTEDDFTVKADNYSNVTVNVIDGYLTINKTK